MFVSLSKIYSAFPRGLCLCIHGQTVIITAGLSDIHLCEKKQRHQHKPLFLNLLKAGVTEIYFGVTVREENCMYQVHLF